MLKKLYRKFLCIPKQEKVSETVFVTRIILSVMCMLVCVVILCSATYAYFTASTYSGVNTIITATYSLEISTANAEPVSGNVATMLSNEEYKDRNIVSGNDAATVSGGDASKVSGNNEVTVSGNDVATVSGNDVTMLANSGAKTFSVTGNKIVFRCNETAENNIFIFNLKASGSATTGFCKVTIEGEDTPYFAGQVEQGQELTLKIKNAQNKVITFEPAWGSSAIYVIDGNTYGGEKMIECDNVE